MAKENEAEAYKNQPEQEVISEEAHLGRTVKVVLSSVSIIGAIIGAFLTVDSRYVLASDFEKYQKQSDATLTRQIQEVHTQGLLLRKQLVEDRLFELDTKRDQGNLNAVEEAQYKRYQRQQEEIEKSFIK